MILQELKIRLKANKSIPKVLTVFLFLDLGILVFLISLLIIPTIQSFDPTPYGGTKWLSEDAISAYSALIAIVATLGGVFVYLKENKKSNNDDIKWFK